MESLPLAVCHGTVLGPPGRFRQSHLRKWNVDGGGDAAVVAIMAFSQRFAGGRHLAVSEAEQTKFSGQRRIHAQRILERWVMEHSSERSQLHLDSLLS